MTTHALYRIYNKRDELLYVGMTGRPVRRMGTHLRTQEWASEIHRIEVAHYKTRNALIEAEQRAITSEQPLYNVVYSTRIDTESMTEEELAKYLKVVATVDRFLNSSPRSRRAAQEASA